MNTYHINTAHMSLALNGSFALEHFEHGNAIEIRNGIMFIFYPGLPHIQIDIGSIGSANHIHASIGWQSITCT